MIAEQKTPRPRHELKYQLDNLQYQILRKKLAIVLTSDPHAGPAGYYHVRSLYFDDFKNSALYEKISGVVPRKKYRLRIYNYSDEYIKFERKIKINQYVFKESVRLTRKEADHIIAGNIKFLENSKNSLLRSFYLESYRDLLHPVIMVDYQREAYVHPLGNIRITFDTNLHTNQGSANFFDPNAFTIRVPEVKDVILEVKYDFALPHHIQGLFPKTIQPALAIGKFAVCRTSKPLPDNFS
ncbi:MAG: polyphosphate polymerase domain-containing protein [Candidatus Bathyarchaeota archaeon]|nr:polyphosphate polymerase domain-containing protein [Candidatus Bathyarchaeota archaeon]